MVRDHAHAIQRNMRYFLVPTIGQYVFFSFLKGWHGLAGNVIVTSSPGDRIGGVTQLTGKSDT